MTTTEETAVRCACSDCTCMVSTAEAVEQAGELYCSDSCALGHEDQPSGCGHEGCACRG